MKTLRRILQDIRTAGVAQLNNNIYVLLRDFLNHTFLTVYDAVSFERLEDVELSLKEGEHVKGFNIVACSVNQCLYVVDIDNNCILRLEIKNEGKAAKWQSPESIQPLTPPPSTQGHTPAVAHLDPCS